MMNPSDQALDALARSVGEALLSREALVACAESCTGGWVSKALTDIPGSSAWFGFGFVTYANEAKRDALGVGGATLAEHGAVSEEVVVEMATGARQKSGAEFSVAVSGVAGPDGGTDDKPVGTVWFAWAATDTMVTERCLFSGDRESVRRQSVEHALQGLLRLIRADG